MFKTQIMIKIIPSIVLVALFSLVSCNTKKKEKETKPETETETIVSAMPKLQFLWETDSLMVTCESVLYDGESKIIYVANVNQAPWEKDGNGFISTINTKGEVLDLKWAENLSGPKGMGIHKGMLYVNDIDRVVAIDMETRKEKHAFSVEGNPQLNDITVGKDAIYASSSALDAIYKIQDTTITQVAKDSLGRLNGLLYQKEGIYYTASKSHNFGVFDENTNTFKNLTSNIGHGDGIVRLKNGDFIVSSWQGEVFYIYSKDWSAIQLLDTRDKKINAADIDFIPETQTLLVPTFFHNRVVAYKLLFE
ncbi:ATP/GTP-binding protein [Flavobacteriaceae bacterium MHTCC 0001]